jgi:hypothetical protein
VAVAAVAVVEAVGVMVILTMDMVVVTMATAAREATDGNCSNDPLFAFSSRWVPTIGAPAPLGILDARCAPPAHPLRPQTVAVSTRVL